MHGSVRLVLVDGLPGAGKTTTSRRLAAYYRSQGIDCGWAREEDSNHPFFGPEVRALHRRADYDDVCVARWQLLATAATDQPWVLDGCALQSTVRFMFERSWTFERIEHYWQAFEAVAGPVGAAHVYLTHTDPEVFIRDHVMKVRGPVWAKIAAHVEATPAGGALRNAGLDAPVEFWVQYRRLCDSLMAHSTLPVLTIDVTDGWARVPHEVRRWLHDLDGD